MTEQERPPLTQFSFSNEYDWLLAHVDLSQDNASAWSVSDINEHMTHIATNPLPKPVVLMMGNETHTYYIIRQCDLNLVNTKNLLSAWATVYHCEYVERTPRLTNKCPECGCTQPFTQWEVGTGKKVENV